MLLACLERLLVLLAMPPPLLLEEEAEELFFVLPMLFPQKWQTMDTCWHDSLATTTTKEVVKNYCAL